MQLTVIPRSAPSSLPSAPQAPSAPATAAPAPAANIPVGGTAGALQTMFGAWFEQLGAIGRGTVVDAQHLQLRFASNAEALAARALLEPTVDGVSLGVTLADGRPPLGADPSPRALADTLLQLDAVVDAMISGRPAPRLQVGVASEAGAARLNWLLRDTVAGMPVQIVSVGAPGA